MSNHPFAIVFIYTHDALASETREDISTYCEREWGNDYRMREYCERQQIEAAHNVITMFNELSEGSEEQRIIQRCLSEWTVPSGGYDWRMVRHCADQQITAYERSKSASDAAEGSELLGYINDFCKSNWPDDYRMEEYCRTEQIGAARATLQALDALQEDSEEAQIIGRCAAQWAITSGGYDWRMVRYCSEQQLGALERLRR